MTQQDVAQTLHEIEFLRDLPREHIAPLAAAAKLVDFPAGEAVFRQGDVAVSIYLVVSGSVSLEICAPGVGCKQILTVGPGELLGWSPVLQQQRLTATARVLSPTQTIQLDGPQVLAACEQNPRLGYDFMKCAALALAKRLNATRLQLLNVYGSEMPHVPDLQAGQQSAESSSA